MDVIQILENQKINRDVVIGVRMTPEEVKLIDTLAKKDERSRSGFLHMLIFSHLEEVRAE